MSFLDGLSPISNCLSILIPVSYNLMYHSPLEQHLYHFLKKHHHPERPLVVGFSGGPDSLCLLHLLLKYRAKEPLKIHLAHVDHGWRPESAEEAKLLQQQADLWGIPFYLKVLKPDSLKGNLEAACREERLRFFADIYHSTNSQAVLLGHHADDQAETVLKRVLEGVTLPYLSALQMIKQMSTITLWRPLLNTTKKEIERWLAEQEIVGIQDSTNTDPRFLRGRMRYEILPSLSNQFGKEISRSLCNLGNEALELREYLEEKVKPYQNLCVSGPSGQMYDLSSQGLSSPVEIKYLIRRICEEHDVMPSRQMLEEACALFLKGAANRQVKIGDFTIIIDRQRFIIPKYSS